MSMALNRFFFLLRYLVAQSRSPRRTAQTVQATMVSQTKPNTTIRLQRTLTEASRPTPLRRDKQENVQTAKITSSVLSQNKAKQKHHSNI